ncbi:hypothetical protein [Micromonospora tulbaghiae]|uniref:hypothetical protein n=1 Tax=Micromonospora tulbaghiae TaxID=479978 RepID=UPI003EC07CF1
MTWPGQRVWRPPVGLVAVLSRDYYNPRDPHARRPTVVVRVLPADRACLVVTRTSDTMVAHSKDIWHDKDPELLCDRQGWWQPRRVHRVDFGAYDDEDTKPHVIMSGDLLDRIIAAYQEFS